MDEDTIVLSWVDGLPTAEDLTPLSQPLITPELAAAFGVVLEPQRSILDVYNASQETIEALRRGKAPPLPPEGEESEAAVPSEGAGEGEDEQDDGEKAEDAVEDPATGRAAKKPRLLWTPHLHKRFVDVVAHLGIKNAVPKTIMQLMNVEGLTRENVASHLQKYRLYLKRRSGDVEPSVDDSSVGVKEREKEKSSPVMPPYAVMPMPVLGGSGHLGMMPVNGQMRGGAPYPWYAAQRPYAVIGRPAEWPGRNKIGSNSSSQRVLPKNVA